MTAQLRVYRQRISSVQKTKKITRAMELIAASRIQKARLRVKASNPYTQAIVKAVSAVATFSDIDHPLATEPEVVSRSAVLIMTSDRGLAGAYSSNVIKEAEALIELLNKENKEVDIYVFGRKGNNYFTFRNKDVKRFWWGCTDYPLVDMAKSIAEVLLQVFMQKTLEGGVDEIHVVSTRFKNMVEQDVEVLRLLPLEVVEDVGGGVESSLLPVYEFEPSAEEVLDSLLPNYIESCLFNLMLHCAASELAARQSAMKSATDNAEELVKKLSRQANAARQSEITQMISEIVGGADALSGVDDS